MNCQYCGEPSELPICEDCLTKISVKALKALRLEHSIDGQVVAVTKFRLTES